MAELTLVGEERKSSGTGSSRVLRRDGRIPAVVCGFNENKMMSVVYKDFLKEYQRGNLFSKLFYVKLGERTLKVILREVQIDPVTDNPIHIDFQLIKEDVPVKVFVRVKVINKEKSPGLKRGGVLNIVKKIVHLNCIPKNIPKYLEIDVSGFEIGRNVHINDIGLPSDVTPVEYGNFTILTVVGRVEEKEEIEKTEQVVEEFIEQKEKEKKE